MELNIATKQAYSEVDEFLELLDEKTRNEIPLKLRQFFKEQKDKRYQKKINPNIAIKEQNLKKETLAIIAMLNLQYWCKNEAEKERLKNIYAENDKKYEENQRKIYNPDNIFKNKSKAVKISTEGPKQMIVNKDSFMKRIWNKILKIFNFKK